MIKELEISNFKCFQAPNPFSFTKMNLLTGINGRGKSSLLQSILLLSQSAWKDTEMKKLIINDEYLQLGNFDDIKNSETVREKKISFGLQFDSINIDEVKYEYQENELDALLADLYQIEFKYKGESTVYKDPFKGVSTKMEMVTNALKKIHFVSADRLGPVKYVDKTNLPEFLHVGTRGEYAINILANSDKLDLVDNKLYMGNDSKSVIQQTEEWLNYILDGAKIEIIGKDKQSSVLSILFNSRKSSSNYKPNNVGFGYSYILPLILTGLIAKAGEIIIIENPEAHLHPRAQSKIIEFFARVASSGVQVFIESHSEHILNSMRVCALNKKIDITNKDLSIFYFDQTFTPINLHVDEKGKIEDWPVGFFDQQEIDLSTIFQYSVKQL